MRLYIPEIGDEIELEKDWDFTLVNEFRNDALLEKFHPEKIKERRSSFDWKSYGKPVGTITLPKGTILKIDRIYVRKGASDYSSITFITIPPDKKEKKIRFFASLTEANKIEFSERKRKDSIQIREDYMNKFYSFSDLCNPGLWAPRIEEFRDKSKVRDRVITAYGNRKEEIASLRVECHIEFDDEKLTAKQIEKLRDQKFIEGWEPRDSGFHPYFYHMDNTKKEYKHLLFSKVLKREYFIFDGNKKIATVRSASTLKTKMRELLKDKLSSMGYSV